MTITALSSDALSYVCAIVRDHSAIELDDSKAYLIEARLAPVARNNGFTSIDDFITAIRNRRQLKLESILVEAMTTNETSFYRDQHPFTAMRKTLLLEICKRNAAQKSLNIWSAACSTGQEIYSVAMDLREYFPELASWKVLLLATDLSDAVLARGQAAKFSQSEINRGLPTPLLAKYFHRNGVQWELRPEIRGMVSFFKLNLIERWPPLPLMDIVFLRNVLIYFAPETKRMILKKVRSVMAPQAVLFLGAAETTMNLDDNFERVQADNSVFYRLKQE